MAEYIGMDFETSGIDPDQGHVPIQLGLSMPDGTTKSWVISGPGGEGWDWVTGDNPHGQHVWDPAAADIHKMTKEQVALGQTCGQVALEARQFIAQHSGVSWKGDRRFVGWNVASFDVPFMRAYLATILGMVGYQSADLNAAVFLLSEAYDLDVKTLKADCKQYAEDNLADSQYELGIGEHDAGYDAASAVLIWEYLQHIARMGHI